MVSLGVVLTVVAHASTHATRMFVNCLVEVTTRGVVVTVAFFTSIRLFAQRRLPWQIVEEVFALLTIQSFRVVRTFTPSVHHIDGVSHAFQGQTT